MDLKIISLFLLLICASVLANAQSGKVTRNRNLIGVFKYHQNGQKLSEKEFLEVLQPYLQSYDLMRTARKNSIWGGIIGSAGMILILTELNPPNFDQEINPAILIPGLVLFAAGLPLNIKYIRQSGLALDLYNESQIRSGYFRPKPELRMGFMGAGLGLQVKF